MQAYNLKNPALVHFVISFVNQIHMALSPVSHNGREQIANKDMILIMYHKSCRKTNLSIRFQLQHKQMPLGHFSDYHWNGKLKLLSYRFTPNTTNIAV